VGFGGDVYVSGIWFRKFYDPNDLEKKTIIRAFEKNGSRIKLFRKPERSDVIRRYIRVLRKTGMTMYQ